MGGEVLGRSCYLRCHLWSLQNMGGWIGVKGQVLGHFGLGTGII